MIYRNFLAAAALVIGSMIALPATAALTITPITWNVVGLDSNSPTTGPFRFPVAARVCAVGAPSNGAVSAAFAFQAGGTNNGTTGCTGGVACITLRSGTLMSYPLTTGALAAGSCADAYFEVQVFNSDSSAFSRARRFTITATDASGSISTPQPRELYVEKLISQNRNSVQNVSYSAAKLITDPFPTPVGPGLTSVSAGGSFGLAVGSIYDIRLDASTATQGYEQLETFANFSNAVFRVLQVQSTYSANTSPFYPPPPNTITSFLYANGCDWQLSPVLPNYLGCQGVGKTGGTISATYRIQVLTVPSGSTSALNTLIYDYSGSSFHYNADTGTGGRTIYVESPASATIAKTFGPSTITAGGTSTLTFTISNPNRFSAVTLASFTDTLPTAPGQMSVANPQNVTYSGCGPGVFSPNPPLAGAISLSFSGATIQPQSDCVFTIDVTAAVEGTYNNTSSFLAINGVATTSQASASLVVGPLSSPPICAPLAPRIEIARWNFSALVPPAAPVHPFAPSFLISGVAVSTGWIPRVPPGAAGVQSSSTIGNAAPSWSATGWPSSDISIGTTIPASGVSSLLEFDVETTAYSNIAITIDGMVLGNGVWAAPANNNGRFYHRFNDTGTHSASTGGLQNFNKSNSADFLPRTWTTIGVGDVNFQFAIAGANSDTAVFLADNVVVTGCNQFISQPTLTKSFATDPIVVGTNSRLSFVITNPNATQALTGVTFTDALPAGLQVAPVPNTSFSAGCVGADFTGITAGNTTLTFLGGVSQGNTNGGICTAQVDIRGTTAGLKSNITSAIFTNETQTNTGPSGYGEDTLLVYADSLSKSFSPSPIVTNGISTLTFVVTNPSATSPITSVGFVDNFPAGLVVAGTPNLTRSPASCGAVGVNWNNTGAAEVTLNGVTVAAAASCTYTVDVTSAAAATYPNLSNALTFQVNGAGPTITGDTAAASLIVNAPISAIGLRKQIALTNTPSTVWSNFVSMAPATNVFYKFTVENTGSAVLTRPGSGFWVVDALIPGAPFCNTLVTLPVAVPGNDNHIFECIVGPITTPGTATTLQNSATASSTTVSSAVARATYTSKLPDLLVAKSRIAPVGPVNTNFAVNVTYRINVTNQAPSSSVNDTLAPITVEDTLRSGVTYTSFTSADPFWSCALVQTAPLHKISCSYSGTLIPSPGPGNSTSFDITVRVAPQTPDINNVAVALNGGDPECNQTSESPINDCKGPFAEATVPVTLSHVEVKESGPDLVVNFNTATEAGTIGFRVLADIGKGVQARVEIGSVASKTIDSLKEQSYTVRARNPGADQVWIEESSVDGSATLYGPYKVGVSVGEVGLAQTLNWAAVIGEQNSFRATQNSALRGLSVKSAEIRVSTDAWVRVTQEQLVAAGVDLTGQSANNIAVRLGSETVPARVNLGAKAFGPGSTIEFFAKAVKNSLYTKTAVYRIEIGRSLALAEIDARTTGASVGSEVQAVADTLLLNNNTTYSFSSPLEDPWFSFRALRSGGAAVGVGSINFTLKDRVAPPVGDGATKPGDPAVLDETLEVSFWGGLDYAGTAPDHMAVFKLNGMVLGQAQFDGFAARTQRFVLPQGSLLNGTNTFRVELPNSTGFAADIVNVESVAIGYMRKLSPQTDRFSVVLPATPTAPSIKSSANGADKGPAAQINASTFVVTGLSGAPVVAVLERAGVQSVLKTDAVSGGSLRIELAALAGDRLSLMPVENGVLPTAAIALEDPISGDPVSYLIISHPSFIANLSPLVLAKQQQGYRVKVVDVEAIYRFYSAGVIDPAAIQLAIRRAQQKLGTTHVLLVGGDTYDYQNVLGVNSVSFIPTNYRRSGQIIAFMPSDAVYADTDGNGVSNVAIGRWPVRTNAELNAVIAKTLNYQNAKKALFVSDRSLNGISFANSVPPLAALLGNDWTVNRLSLDSYATGSAAMAGARADIVSALNQGVSLFSYYGHSSPASWSREGLITASQVNGGLFSSVNQAFATVQLGCWGTYFVEPTSTTVAHQMLLMPKGAAAIIGSTSLTDSSSDIALANQLLPLLSSTSLGDALLQAQQAVANESPEAKDVILGGTLLGDPALK